MGKWRLLAAVSLIAPALVFGYAGVTSYRAIEARATERIERALDAIQDEVLGAFQLIRRTIADTNTELRGLSDDQIRADEARLSLRLKDLQGARPQMEAIWVFDRGGWALVSSTVFPVLRDVSNADRDYFRAHVEQRAALFIGDIVQARVGTLRFFVVSGRRPESPDGAFNGIVGVTVLPEYFYDLFRGFSDERVSYFGLLREDGAVLAGYPTMVDHPGRLGAQSEFIRAVQSRSWAGVVTTESKVDGLERRIGYRLLPGYPVYLQAGIETADISREIRATLFRYAAFGLATALALFGLAVVGLRRMRR